MIKINSPSLTETNKLRTLKIGIIGCGRAAEFIYLPALNSFDDVEVVGVVDPYDERRELLSKKLNNCACYSSLDQKLIDEIDAAIIITPPDTHVALASVLLRNNKYILIEKPLALTMDDCIRELIEIERLSKASLMMGFNHRYWQPAMELREKLSYENKILSAKIIFTGDYSKWDPVSFRSDALNDLGPHVLDLIRSLFNKEIISIQADSFTKNNIDMKVKIAGEIIIGCHIAHSDRTVKRIKVIGGKKNYYLELGSERLNPEFGTTRKLLDIKDRFKRKLLRRTSPIKKSYQLQLAGFFNFVKTNKPAVPGIEDGIAAIKAIATVQESIKRNGKEVFTDEIK